MIFQLLPINGLSIIWASGKGTNTAGGYTAQDIDNEIAIRGISSIMEVHKTIFNKWLTDCNINTDVGGLAETLNQQAVFISAFELLCFYAYSKAGFLQDLQSGNCDCDCQEKKKDYLKYFSEDVICKAISNSCLKGKYLDWLHGVCDTKTVLYDFWGSDVICEHSEIMPRRKANDCGCNE